MTKVHLRASDGSTISNVKIGGAEHQLAEDRATEMAELSGYEDGPYGPLGRYLSGMDDDRNPNPNPFGVTSTGNYLGTTHRRMFDMHHDKYSAADHGTNEYGQEEDCVECHWDGVHSLDDEERTRMSHISKEVSRIIQRNCTCSLKPNCPVHKAVAEVLNTFSVADARVRPGPEADIPQVLVTNALPTRAVRDRQLEALSKLTGQLQRNNTQRFAWLFAWSIGHILLTLFIASILLGAL